MGEKNQAQPVAVLKKWFEQAVQDSGYQTWQREGRGAWDFYDGSQWTAEEAQALREVGQPAIVINKIAAKVDNLAGVEVSGRTRVIYRSRSGQEQEDQTAAALTDLALYVAEKGEQAAALSQVFKDGMVGGIGWLEVGVRMTPGEKEIFFQAEDPFSVVFDPLCRRADLSDARFVARERWLPVEEIQGLFGAKAAQVVGRLKTSFMGAAMTGLGSGPFNHGGGEVSWYAAAREVYRVVEMQYLMPATQWAIRRPDGRLVTTWEKPPALAKSVLGTIENVGEAMRVRVAYFAGDVLLDDRWLAEGYDGFTLIPYVYRRQKSDGRPYGLVRAAIDPQRELNKRRSKAMHLLNTAQVIADIDAVDDPAALAREAARPDGLILKRPGKDLRIERNTDLAASQVAVMQQAATDIQEVIGVFDETLGKQSNATSGVAIQQRQAAGSLNQMAAFDTLRALKKRMGQQVLGLIRQYFTNEMVIRVVDQLGAARMVQLNAQLRGADGEPVVLHDVSAGDYDVVVEEARDVLSAREEEADQIGLLLQAGVPIPPAILVELSNVRHKAEILAALPAVPAAPARPAKNQP